MKTSVALVLSLLLSLAGALPQSLAKGAKATEGEAAAKPPESLPPITIGDPSTALVLVALIYDKSCYVSCQKIRPIVKELVTQYGTQVAYAEMDTSAMKDACRTADQLRIKAFLADGVEQAPVVGFFPPSRRLFKQLLGPKERAEYAKVIDVMLAKGK